MNLFCRIIYCSPVFRSFQGKKSANPKKKKKGKRKKGKMSKKLSPKAGPWLNVLHISNNGIDEQSTETSIDSCETFQFIKRLVVKFNMTCNHFHNILRLLDVTNFFFHHQ